jgi:hypothetical protein
MMQMFNALIVDVGFAEKNEKRPKNQDEQR